MYFMHINSVIVYETGSAAWMLYKCQWMLNETLCFMHTWRQNMSWEKERFVYLCILCGILSRHGSVTLRKFQFQLQFEAASYNSCKRKLQLHKASALQSADACSLLQQNDYVWLYLFIKVTEVPLHKWLHTLKLTPRSICTF